MRSPAGRQAGGALRALLVAGAVMAGPALPLVADAAPDAGVPADAGPATDIGPQTARMAGLVDEAFRGLAHSRNLEGLAVLQRGDLPGALAAFKEARELDPASSEVTNNLAHLHGRLGNVEDAERWYRETLRLDPGRFIAHVNLADLLAAPTATTARIREAAGLLVRARELRGNDPPVVRRQARLAARLGQSEAAERFYRELAERGPVDEAVALEIGDFHRDFGRFDEALSWYRRFPQAAAERIRTLEVEREARRWGLVRAAPDVPASARTLAARGRLALDEGRLAEATAALEEAIRQAPRFSQARADLAAAEAQGGRFAEAERHLLLALALDHGNADLYVHLARLYRPSPERPELPGRPPESLILISQALQLEPDRALLHWEAALSAQAAGDLAESLRHVGRFLDLAGPEAPERAAAEALRASVESAVGPGRSEAATAPTPPSAWAAAINRARGYLSRGEADAALAELARVEGGDAQPEVQRLRGRILHAAGRDDEAALAFEQALPLVPAADQPALRTELGRLRLRQGRLAEARRHLEAADAAGEREAGVVLAGLDVAALEARGRGSLEAVDAFFAARARLADLSAQEGHSPADADRLLTLRRRLDALAEGPAVVVAALLVALAAALSAWLLHRFGGADLARLLARHPEAGPEVQRLLSAIRHEVLKHNTLMLSGLVDALSQGEPAAEKAAFCRRSLLGEAGVPGALDRLRGYTDQLRQVGRAHGVRLNLEHRDPALSALIRGFARLRAAEPGLRRVDALSPRGLRGLLRQLTGAAHLLNVEGYEAVRSLLDRLRVLRVDATLLAAIFERARREPAVAGARLASPVIAVDRPVGGPPGDTRSEGALAIAVPRAALEDILVNLMRNALHSTMKHGPSGPIRLGIFLAEEIDDITGLSRAIFRIMDCSPQVLTREMLRGRYIEAGLGLTADLVSRYEGTLDVESAPPPWTKAVVVKLPQVPVEGPESAAETDEAGAAGFGVA